MARNLFPADRVVYRDSGGTVTVADDDRVLIWADEAATTPADIVTFPAGDPITGSRLTTDGDGRLPVFYGPDGATLLWATLQTHPSQGTFELAARSAGPVADPAALGCLIVDDGGSVIGSGLSGSVVPWPNIGVQVGDALSVVTDANDVPSAVQVDEDGIYAVTLLLTATNDTSPDAAMTVSLTAGFTRYGWNSGDVRVDVGENGGSAAQSLSYTGFAQAGDQITAGYDTVPGVPAPTGSYIELHVQRLV